MHIRIGGWGRRELVGNIQFISPAGEVQENCSQCFVKFKKWSNHPACQRFHLASRKLEAYATNIYTPNLKFDKALDWIFTSCVAKK